MKRIVFVLILFLIFISFISSISFSNPEWITEELDFIKEGPGKNLILADYIPLPLLQDNFQILIYCFSGILLVLNIFWDNLQMFKKFTVLRQ